MSEHTEAKMKADVGPEDFGVPAEFADRARHFANFMAAEQVRAAILAERERAAKIAESWKVNSPNNWNQIGQTETAAGIAAAIRRGSV